ncbi:TetR/AcrR family transcriptional regulator [Micromonospora sp. HUAS LYJ1]|uniref:TetR/AcrR family transcriptional regulator n=1 Tax=Micromonospora sp. HUAS LYJ1 TaxID=3061626 RepID=UPI0026714E60|nr:TetR family transcriptional regulator [Micromonospora sp. HUAS LYJ1]WKU05397.1 TetR family transcriptional regulator [Micromonospora sp. HUAS LYJ1]
MSPGPVTAKGAATSRRILDAAADEFAERGIAGARIDRITATARTNKAQVYGYFGNKDGLFDAVIADRADQLLSVVAFDADDLPASAVAMYDANLRDPQLVRLLTWLRLERQPTGSLGRAADHQPKLTAIARAQAAGRVRAGDPFDLFTLVLSMAFSWSAASIAYAATTDEPDETHERRRTLLAACVRDAISPGTAPPD